MEHVEAFEVQDQHVGRGRQKQLLLRVLILRALCTELSKKKKEEEKIQDYLK